AVVLYHSDHFLVVYFLLSLGFEPFVEGLFRYPTTSIEPFSFIRCFFFFSISFANVLGNDFFDISTPVMSSMSAMMSCWKSFTNSSSSIFSFNLLISSFLRIPVFCCTKLLYFLNQLSMVVLGTSYFLEAWLFESCPLRIWSTTKSLVSRVAFW